jgi:murein DD-endopeptidase MepM/ murein hydrolase activator NlpD
MALEGPDFTEGLEWWQVSREMGIEPAQNGWMALAAPDGTRLLAPAQVADALRVTPPFQIPWPVTQGWGANPQVYNQFTYDGVPLKGHNGLDFGTPVGTPILAIDDAVVLRADFEPNGFGHYVLLQHAWGESIYAHLDRIDVLLGASVAATQPIGVSGNSGFSTGPHLHFGIRVYPYRRTDGWGGFANPVPFLPQDRLVFPFLPEFEPSPMAPELPGRLRP